MDSDSVEVPYPIDFDSRVPHKHFLVGPTKKLMIQKHFKKNNNLTFIYDNQQTL